MTDPTRKQPPPPPVFCPARLRARRHLAGLTHQQVAHRAQLDTQTVTAYETGQQAPTDTDTAALAHALGTDPDTLRGPPDLDPSTAYWQTVCAALPPFTETEIDTIAQLLRRTPRRANSPDTGSR